MTRSGITWSASSNTSRICMSSSAWLDMNLWRLSVCRLIADSRVVQLGYFSSQLRLAATRLIMLYSDDAGEYTERTPEDT